MKKVIEYIAKIKKIILKNPSLAKKILAIIIAVIIVIVIASCLGKNNNQNIGNIFNKGFATVGGNWIYYVEFNNDGPIAINRVKDNGEKIENIADGNLYYINIVDNYIYCLEYDEDKAKNNLVKIKKNGKGKEILVADIDDKPILTTDKYIFYFKNSNFYKVKLNGKERVKLSDKDISYYYIEGKMIYYIYEKDDYQCIARMDLDGKDNKRIGKINLYEGTYEALHIKNNKVYYIKSKSDNNGSRSFYLYKMNLKGENVDKICKLDESVDAVNMQEDKIYYTVTKDYDTDTIYSVKYNGTNKEKIKSSKPIDNLNIIDKWIFITTVNEEYDIIGQMISLDGKETIDL